MARLERDLDQAWHRLGQHILEAWHEKAVPRVIVHLRLGDAAATILQTAIDIGASIVVVGTHQRAGLERLVHGSVAERIVRQAR